MFYAFDDGADRPATAGGPTEFLTFVSKTMMGIDFSSWLLFTSTAQTCSGWSQRHPPQPPVQPFERTWGPYLNKWKIDR